MNKNDFKNGLNQAALVGPFPDAGETRLKKFCLFFKPVVIALPWYLDSLAVERGEGAGESIRFIYPPEDLKPQPDFIKQAADFKQGLVQNRDRESNAYLQAVQSREKRGETGREIERVLRGLDSPVPSQSQNRSRSWTLTLHLAHEIETREAEAAQILAQIRTRPSPLSVLQEAEEESGFLAGLPPGEPESRLSAQHLEQVCAAWCGLFESRLAEYPFLILDRKPAWEFLGGITEADQTEETVREFAIPDPAPYALPAWLELRNARLKPQYREGFHKALHGLADRPREAQAELDRAGREIEKAWPEELKKQNLVMKIRILRPIKDPACLRKRPWLKTLFNKALIYME